jgi:regulator of replication initiation timing
MLKELNLDGIQDENARECIRKLLNIIEAQASEIRALREENQRLRDENNHLKGEQGKPDIKANVKKQETKDISSEKERHEKKEWKKCSKKEKIKINRTEICKVAKTSLPEDAVFKGYEEVLFQDLLICPDNTLFRKEKYYSPSERKTYIANLPEGYEGKFGPGIKALTIISSYCNNMTEPKIM